MLVSAEEMLTKAKAGKYAVGQFNINNLEWTKAILLTAQELNSPVILGVSEGAGKYMCGYKTVVGMVNGILEELNITVPVALHLDHGTYVVEAHEKGGAKAAKDIEELVSEVTGMFAGGELSEDAIEGAYKALTDAYWIAKENNKKYAPKTRRKKSDQ